ncbi:MAG: hypothetical protein E7240_05525 [Lachnospiraceae bacterium]|nr:hypothetical protein [Lachnospiraceae bacterium]
MQYSIQEQALAYLADYIKDDASITIEQVLTKKIRSSLDGVVSIPFAEDGDDECFRTEQYLHIARRGEYSEICISYPLSSLEEMREKRGWEPVARIFREELAQAGILRNEEDGPDGSDTGRIYFGNTFANPMHFPDPGQGEKQPAKKTPTANELMAEMDEEDRALFEKLRVLRKEMAIEKSVAPYVIFSNRTLAAMCEKLPVTLEELRELPGVGKRNSAQYGERFLEVIRDSAGAV